jgi:hypothetical protein
MLLVLKVGVWRDVEVMVVGDVLIVFFARAVVWGDVDPHGGDLGAGEHYVSVIVVEERAPALFQITVVCLPG